MAKILPKNWINAQLDKGYFVQCAVSVTNSTYFCYLTTSGKVCRREYNYEEDCDLTNDFPRIDIPRLTFSSVGRLNRLLENCELNQSLV